MMAGPPESVARSPLPGSPGAEEKRLANSSPSAQRTGRRGEMMMSFWAGVMGARQSEVTEWSEKTKYPEIEKGSSGV